MNHDVWVFLQAGLVLIFLVTVATAIAFFFVKKADVHQVESTARRAMKHYETRAALEDKDRERRLALEGGQSRSVSHNIGPLRDSSRIIDDL